MTNLEKAITAVTVLSETFRQPLTDAAIKGYLLGLDGLGIPAIDAALARALRDCRFMPSPAELRELAGAGGPREIERQGVEAWGAVRQAMDKHDYTISVDFGSLVNAVVRNLGGWQWLCARDLRDLTFVRKDFERVYALLASTRLEDLRGEPLAGAFGGTAVRVQIGPAVRVERQALPEREGSGAAAARNLVRELADGKAAE